MKSLGPPVATGSDPVGRVQALKVERHPSFRGALSPPHMSRPSGRRARAFQPHRCQDPSIHYQLARLRASLHRPLGEATMKASPHARSTFQFSSCRGPAARRVPGCVLLTVREPLGRSCSSHRCLAPFRSLPSLRCSPGRFRCVFDGRQLVAQPVLLTLRP